MDSFLLRSFKFKPRPKTTFARTICSYYYNASLTLDFCILLGQKC